ncbi:uncharacterized protein B0I36DRAFT_356776 [Microdochium trichocladiopsis]|uniref:Uncharacterized protein n=1 Tax=Microdochium trichocladiopsis TaxID=1682393 RepID=A0A9P8XSG0_9PEZI|nr:uncharacterized protein B0I36DRAFT_356776 [Microdochium trichocladiopsis]KAH7009293.1 hypothetical protein B0I36DRAFT_356776 [Microdochium trichocladiopsis]
MAPRPVDSCRLLVLDCVTKLGVLSRDEADSTTPGIGSGVQQRSLLGLLSNVSHGSILVTIGDKDTALALGIKCSDTLSLSAMRGTQAVNLLQKKLGKILEHNSLKIVWAAAIRGLCSSFQDGCYQFRRDCSASDLIKACWRPVIGFLEPTSCKVFTPATALPSFMAFSDRDNIPKSITEFPTCDADASAVSGADQGNESDFQSDKPPQIGDRGGNSSTGASERDVQDLLDAGRIAAGDFGIFSMRQAVQLAMRHWLKNNG